MKKVVKERKDAYFLFLNTDPFCSHERVIHLPRTSDLDEKSAFIATCDAMLHCRKRGETFGLAIAEFSVMNKPVITTAGKENAHLEMLGDKAIVYTNKRDLRSILLNISRSDIQGKDWDVYSRPFAPAEVVKRFQATFIDGISSAAALLSLGANVSSLMNRWLPGLTPYDS